MKAAILETLKKLEKKSLKKLLDDRYEKFRNLGQYADSAAQA